MKCYYEELCIARDASDAEIKSAYKKLALRWHPDKNLECLDEAKERFLLIQQAYEVLSDAQERAWYDNHREQILRGKNSEYEENCLDLFQYFRSSCYKGYGDDEKGFYAVYREVFTKIACEDADFIDDEEELLSIPNFGSSDSSYDDIVGPFYAYWSAYSTKKTYEWLSPYDIREIKDRRILREVEKEMKKIVAKARKVRNEEVRSLVAFVRKRDRRVHSFRQLLMERAEENRVKQEQNRLDKIRRRQQEIQEMSKNSNPSANEEYEEQLKNLQLEYGCDASEEDENLEDESDNEDSETELYEDLYCIACNKYFRNEKAFANHESSKKHREKVAKLKEEMHREETEFQDNEENECEINIVNDSETNDIEKNTLLEAKLSEEDFEIDEDDAVPTSSKRKNNKKSKKNRKTISDCSNNLVENNEDPPDTLDLLSTIKEPIEDEEWKNSSNKKGSKKSKNKKQSKNVIDSNEKTSEVPELSTETSQAAEIPAAKENCSNDTKVAHVCVTCKASFQSKNKLFAHLKTTNHGVYISKTKPEDATKIDVSAKGKKKRK